MTEFSDEALARRLATLDVPIDAALVSRRALAAARGTRRPAPPRWRFVAIVALVLVLLSAGLSYYAPVFAQSLADAPIAGSVAGWLLQQVGLANASHRVTVFGENATSSGYTIELVGGYADAGRTVLFIRVTPPANAFSILKPAEVTDQFGRSYRMSGATWNSDTGEGLVVLTPIDGLAAKLGARLRIAFHEVEVGPGPTTRRIAGRWVLGATLAVDEGRDLPVPEAIPLGRARLAFARVRSLSAALLVELAIENADPAELRRVIPDGLKGRPAFRLRLLDPSGREERPLQAGSTGDGTRTTATWLWQTDGAGPYLFIAEWEGVGGGTRTITVP